MIKTCLLLVLVPCLISTNISNEVLETTDNQVFELFKNNIDLFNQKSEKGTKEETFFNEATDYYNIRSMETDKNVGTLIVFDDNDGYIALSNEYYIIDYNYNKGFELIGETGKGKDIYYLAHKFSYNKEELLKSIDACGSSISDEFYWHGNYSWATEKTRTMLNEYDSSYSTLTNTTSATFKNKTTWSTSQGSNGYCGAFAIANLLWTYKYNQVLDVTGGATTSYNLAWAIKEVVGDDASSSAMLNVNNLSFLSSTGYYLDYWSDIYHPLDSAPAIVLYNQGTSGHYALLTGQGQSLYGTFLWLNIYTNWDITNTWHDRFSYSNGYLSCKYWVDRSHTTIGYVLKDSSGNIVQL